MTTACSLPEPDSARALFRPTLRACLPGLLAAAVAFQGCSTGRSSTLSHYTDAQGRACHVEGFKQPDQPITDKIDVLFVTDTSGSLDQERRAIADGLESFVAALPRTTDVNVAVLLAHGSRGAWTGKLFQTDGGEPVVLRQRDLTDSEIRAHLHRKLTSFATDWDLESDGGEEGLYSTQQLVSGGRLAQARDQGFFRGDAALAVVFIADENDLCATYPAGVTPVPDPEQREAAARARDCAGVTPAGVLRGLTDLKGDQPLVVSAVIYTDPARVPAGAENEVGYGYTDIVALASGRPVDLANVSGIPSGLGQVGETSASAMLLCHDFALSYASVAEETIKVSVDGARVPHAYVRETSTVHLEQAGDFGSRVSIDYCESR
jgi:hypothetical protein